MTTPTYPPVTPITGPAQGEPWTNVDYRPAVNSTGRIVVFERSSSTDDTPIQLFAIDVDQATTEAVPFLASAPQDPPPTWPYSQTRPDWSWATGKVVFNGADTNTAALRVHTYKPTSPPTIHTVNVLKTPTGYVYPTWVDDGRALIVYNDSASVTDPPVTTLTDSAGVVQSANISGAGLYAGFASAKPGSPVDAITFAGQPNDVAGWGGVSGSGYDQNFNYVFLGTRGSDGSWSAAPIVASTSLKTFDPTQQGRAPVWSPDGNFIVFESNRSLQQQNRGTVSVDAGYALYLADLRKDPVVFTQLTDPGYSAQHAKFFPGGKSVVFTQLLQSSSSPSADAPRIIARIDLTDPMTN